MSLPRRPVILITGGFYPHESRMGMNLSYLDSIERAGGISLVGFPSRASSIAWIATMLDRVDGVVLSGGADVFPKHYGEEPVQGIGRVDPERDAFELEIARIVLGSRKPVLGICRGMQVLNVAAGGTLFQDLSSMKREPMIAHAQTAPKPESWHRVRVLPGCLLDQSMRNSMDDEMLGVNSIHHQAVKQLAQGWVATSWAEDGTIESMEYPGPAFRLAVQWHPEAMRDHLPIFESFVRACAAIQ